MLNNAFEKIVIANPSKTVFNDQLGRMFLLACEAYGAQRALAVLDEDREAYEKKLKTVGVKWWNPANLWAQWGTVAESLVNPPPWDTSLIPPFQYSPHISTPAETEAQLAATN